jgi:hypothetical protein
MPSGANASAFVRRDEDFSPYALAGARLIERGHPAIPVAPGTKAPGQFEFGVWKFMYEWQRYCDRIPTQYEYPLWGRWPDANVGVAIGSRLKVIDVDTDDPLLTAALLSVLPDTPVRKRGRKGFSAFYQGSPAIASAAFNVNGERVVDLLGYGRQTIVPPSLHATTGRRYVWTDEGTLEDTPVESLPSIPEDFAEALGGALAPFGYTPEPVRAVASPSGGGGGLADLNALALASLPLWVPALQLPGTRRSGRGYRAVAAWRGVENPNLSFHPAGIRDHAEGKSYSPLDVVMRAQNVAFGEACTWLRERVEKPDPFDVAAFVAHNMRVAS